jgi:hypothetical protein
VDRRTATAGRAAAQTAETEDGRGTCVPRDTPAGASLTMGPLLKNASKMKSVPDG